MPFVTANAKAPWNTSPEPFESTASTKKAGYFSKEEVLESAVIYHQNEMKDVNYYFVRAMGVFMLICAKEIVKISDNAKVIYELDDTKIQLAIQQKLKRGSHDDKESKY